MIKHAGGQTEAAREERQGKASPWSFHVLHRGHFGEAARSAVPGKRLVTLRLAPAAASVEKFRRHLRRRR